jgi:hypothetical protein
MLPFAGMAGDRLPRLALGFAFAAMVLAAVAVVIVMRRAPPQAIVEAPLHGVEAQDREISVKDLMLLRKPELAVVDHDGVRVIDAELGQRLGLAPGEKITALAGHDIHRDEDLRETLFHAGLARANVLYVELLRDEVSALVRWRLDNSLGSDYEAMKSLRPKFPKSVFAGPSTPDPADPTAPIVAGITKLSDDHYSITRDAKAALIANLVPVLNDVNYISVLPTLHSQNQHSIKLYTVKPTSVAAHVGLEDDDMLEDILVDANQISLVVTRKNNPLMISIIVK